MEVSFDGDVLGSTLVGFLHGGNKAPLPLGTDLDTRKGKELSPPTHSLHWARDCRAFHLFFYLEGFFKHPLEVPASKFSEAMPICFQQEAGAVLITGQKGWAEGLHGASVLDIPYFMWMSLIL